MTDRLRLIRGGEQQEPHPASLPLDRMYLCAELECDLVFEGGPGDSCPRCHSQTIPMRTVLDGRIDYTPLVEFVKALIVMGSLGAKRERLGREALGKVGVRA